MGFGGERGSSVRRTRIVAGAVLALLSFAAVAYLGAGSASSTGFASSTGHVAASTKKLQRQVKSLAKKFKRQSEKVKRLDGELGGLGDRVAALEDAAAGDRLANYAAAAFTPVDDSTHNNAGASACGSFVASQKGSENQGDLNAKLGSFLTAVLLPDGATIQSLTMYANDFSAEDAHVFLVRKLIEDGLSPQFDGYEVVASVSTDGAENGVMRRFNTAVTDAVVDNAGHYYYLELVVCDAIEPFAIQIGYR